MSSPNTGSSVFSNSTVLALESALQQSLVYFKDLMKDLQTIHTESEINKTQYLQQKEKCNSKRCSSAEDLKKSVELKDHIIQTVASILTRLSETKDLNLLQEAFRILFNDISPMVKKENISENSGLITPKEEKYTSNFYDSINEIEGTPTHPDRTSPIFSSKKLKNNTIEITSDFRDKKKCPDNWTTPEKKTIKLTFPRCSRKTSGKLRQSRLNIVALQTTKVVDLTRSPEFAGGVRNRTDSDGNLAPLIKKESTENDDTVLPSPTSGPMDFKLIKTALKDSPVKFKKPSLSFALKKENQIKVEQNDDKNEITNMEESINILNQLPKNLLKDLKKKSPLQSSSPNKNTDVTYCEDNFSISLLQPVNKVGNVRTSPSKGPLQENINVINENAPATINNQPDSIVLQPRITINKKSPDNVKRKILDLKARVCDDEDDIPRKKSEKQALPGWTCDECEKFFGELYKDDPEMLAKKIQQCSKHRSKTNPARPQTSTNFWNPRWEVPEDTDELNKLNGCL